MSATTIPKMNEPKRRHRLAIRRPVTIVMVFVTLGVFGWKSYQQLPVNLMPDISYPTLTVRTEYGGAAPEDVEKLLTRPLEETLSIVGGMVEISSISSPGLSEIVLEFDWGTNMNVAQQDVRDRLDLFQLPREITEKPVILRYDPTLDPVMRVAITGRDLSAIEDPSERQRKSLEDLTSIREAAERYIKSDLEAEKGIAQVMVKGGREEEIQVLVDSERLKSLGLSLSNVVNSLAQQNINLSGGRLKEGKTEYMVRTLNEFSTVEQIRQAIIGTVGGGRGINVALGVTGPAGEGAARQVRLCDVASVELGLKERDTVVRINGQEAVELDVYKEGDANTVSTCNKLKDIFGFARKETVAERFQKRLDRAIEKSRGGRSGGDGDRDRDDVAELTAAFRSRLPDHARVVLVNDQSRFIVASIDEVKNAAIYGGLLALAVLYFFLRDMKSTMLIGVAIPISIVATFIPMFLGHISLNIMSLGGLALGTGRLVDDSIVVLESIFRCKEEGDATADAADRGTHEVAAAVTSSTLTTIAVFFPIAFVEGVAGQLFRDQAMTVTFSLLTSLLVALFLVPMIASRGGAQRFDVRRVVWLLRAYREGREQEGRTRWQALRGVPAKGLRYFRARVVDVFHANFALLFAAVASWRESNGGGLVRFGRLFPLLLAPIFGVLFALHLILAGLAGVASTVLFGVAMLVMGAALGIAWCGRVILWVPLTAFSVGFEAFRDAYTAGLRKLLPFGPVLLVIVMALAVQAFYAGGKLGRELIPPMKQGEFGIRLAAPPGANLDETERRAREIEAVVARVPEVEMCAVQVGLSGSSGTAGRGENIAEFTVTLKSPEINVRRQDAIVDALRREAEAARAGDLTFTLPALFSFKTAVELQVRGDDLRKLAEVGQAALEVVRDVPGVKDAELSMRPGHPEVIIELDRDLLAAKGVGPEQVAQRLRSEVQGDVATRFNRRGNKVDIRVRSDKERLQRLDDLRHLSVTDGYPPLPLSAVAHLAVEEGPSEIRRIDQRQVAVISANVEGRDLGAVSREIEERVRSVSKPADFVFELGGQNRELAVSYNSLKLALFLAIFLVYVVMACQFESLLHPALIMFSIPLAFIGVIHTLRWAHVDVSIMVYIGGIILAGIVTNNAIVLIDYVNKLRARGMTKVDAVVLAGRVRLRPILMTTLTTVLGLIPMVASQGEGAEIRGPLAITIIAGLSSATLLTLVFIPILYNMFGGRDKS